MHEPGNKRKSKQKEERRKEKVEFRQDIGIQLAERFVKEDASYGRQSARVKVRRSHLPLIL